MPGVLRTLPAPHSVHTIIAIVWHMHRSGCAHRDPGTVSVSIPSLGQKFNQSFSLRTHRHTMGRRRATEDCVYWRWKERVGWGGVHKPKAGFMWTWSCCVWAMITTHHFQTHTAPTAHPFSPWFPFTGVGSQSEGGWSRGRSRLFSRADWFSRPPVWLVVRILCLFIHIRGKKGVEMDGQPDG